MIFFLQKMLKYHEDGGEAYRKDTTAEILFPSNFPYYKSEEAPTREEIIEHYKNKIEEILLHSRNN